MRTGTRISVAIVVAALFLLLTFLLWPRPQALYRVTILPSLGGNLIAATGINNQGQVTGYAETPDGTVHFFLWDRTHGMRDLGPAMQTTFYINEAGQIAGTTQDPAGNGLAFLWDRAHGMQVLGTLGGRESVASGLNNRGQVVGRAQTAAGLSHAFVWGETTGMRDLGTLGGAKSEALSINDAGLVFGRADSVTLEYQAFYWDSEKGMTAAGSAAPSDAMWFGMNDRGYALGVERDGALFLWRRDVGIQKLFPASSSPYMAPIVNDANQIVFGEVSYSTFRWWLRRLVNIPRFRCYLWDPQRGRIALDAGVAPKLDENLYVMGLNDQGCLVGALASERRMRGRAVLLEPIPERWGERPGRKEDQNR